MIVSACMCGLMIMTMGCGKADGGSAGAADKTTDKETAVMNMTTMANDTADVNKEDVTVKISTTMGDIRVRSVWRHSPSPRQFHKVS